MSELTGVVGEALHVSFALFARKLILCGELIAIVAMVGWNVDARMGLSVWPRRSLGQSRFGGLVAASATTVLVLYVGFVRDFSELGPGASFTRYGGMCLGSMAMVTLCVALWTDALRDSTDFIGLIGLWAMTATGVVAFDDTVRWSSELLGPIGQFFRSGPEAVHHGFATVLTAGCAVVFAVRRVGARGGPGQFRTLDLCLAFALLALAQGFLAFRGVSAIYILAIPAALGWRGGWRVRLEWGDAVIGAKLHRLPQIDDRAASADVGATPNAL